MGLLEFATENEKKEQGLHGFSARIVRGWLKLRADHLERQLNRRQILVPEDHGEMWRRIKEEITKERN